MKYPRFLLLSIVCTVTVSMIVNQIIINDVSANHGFSTCDGLKVTIQGSASGIIVGTNGDDIIQGAIGDNVIYGLGGDDVLCGGDDNDILYGGDGNDNIIGNGFDSSDIICINKSGKGGCESPDNDKLYGGDGNDELYGTGGDNYICGGEGHDLLCTGSFVRTPSLCAISEKGKNFLYGGEGFDRMYGGNDNDILYGDGNDDRLYGGAGVDTIYGELVMTSCAAVHMRSRQTHVILIGATRKCTEVREMIFCMAVWEMMSSMVEVEMTT